MDEVVARQLPSRTLGHTPAESEDEEGTSLRDLRDESRLGAARLGKSTVTTGVRSRSPRGGTWLGGLALSKATTETHARQKSRWSTN